MGRPGVISREKGDGHESEGEHFRKGPKKLGKERELKKGSSEYSGTILENLSPTKILFCSPFLALSHIELERNGHAFGGWRE